MKYTLGQLSTDNIKIHAHDFDCDIDGGSDGSIATDQNISTGPNATFQSDFKISEYQILPFQYPLAHPKKQVNDQKSATRTRLVNTREMRDTDQKNNAKYSRHKP